MDNNRRLLRTCSGSDGNCASSKEVTQGCEESQRGVGLKYWMMSIGEMDTWRALMRMR